MCGENQPAVGLRVVIDGVFNRIEVVAALLDEERLQIIQVHYSDVESLTAAASAFAK